jgi:hypothetical protein
MDPVGLRSRCGTWEGVATSYTGLVQEKRRVGSRKPRSACALHPAKQEGTPSALLRDPFTVQMGMKGQDRVDSRRYGRMLWDRG